MSSTQPLNVTEDKVRELIRDEIQKADPPPSRFWTFLNSQFGIFLFTSVLLSGVGALYTDRLARIGEDQNRKDQITKYIGEFRHRLSKLKKERDIFARHKEADQSVPLSVVRIVRGEEVTLDKWTVDFVPTIPEFKDVNLIVVVNRLTRLGFTDFSDDAWKAINDIEIKGEDYDEFGLEGFDKDLDVLRRYCDKLIEVSSKES